MTQLFVNNLVVKLASGIDNINNTITVENTTGFPVMVQGDWFYLTLSDKREGGELRWEVVKVTSYSANTLTVIRAQGGTTAQSWSVGSELSLRVTAADMLELEAFKDSKGQVNGLAPLDSSSQVPVLNIPNLDAGKLTSGIIDPARYVAADLLTKIKTVDGASSGLDADLLDGLDSIYFQQKLDNTDSIELGSSLTGNRNSYVDMHSSDGLDYSARLIRTLGVNGNLQFVQTGTGNVDIYGGSGFLRDGYTIWHAGNDGAGSGLDADLLDGLGSTQFLRSDTSGTLAGTLSVTGRVLASQGTGSAGGYSFTGEGGLDTGMFSPSDGVLDLYANAQKQVSITNEMNILAPLRVTGNVVNNIALNNGTADSPGIHFHNPVDNNYVENDLTGVNYRAFGSYNGGAVFYVFDYDLSTKTYKVFDNVVWHAGNDGAGSGLDADLLDGLDSTHFQQKLGNTNSIELGNSLTGDRDSYIDLHSSNGLDYSARMHRLPGVDGQFQIVQTGNSGIDVIGGSGFLRDGYTVWHDGLASKSFSSKGYQKLPSGLIIQWGTISHVVGTNDGDTASTTFTFPVAFPNKVLSVTVANSGSGDEFLENISASTDTSLTSTLVVSRRVYGSNGDAPVYVSILAIGY